MKYKISTTLGAAVLFAPLFLLAAPANGLGDIGNTVGVFINFINSYLVPAIFALAFLLFLWGMFKFFFVSGASSEGKEQGKNLMLWGVIAFVVMVSIWGLVNLVATGLGFGGATAPPMPTIPIPS